MKNCITTKLKEAVTGNGFFKANELVFKLTATENTWLRWISKYTSATTATLEGGAYFVSGDGSTESLGTSKQVTGDEISIFVPKGEHYLKIQDKTKISALGSADFSSFTFQDFINNSTSPSFKIELYGDTLKYATNITVMHLTTPYYCFYEIASIFRNKNIVRAIITAKDILIGTVKELFEGPGTIEALTIKNQTKLTGDTSILNGKEMIELILSGNIFDINLNDLYNIKGKGLTITDHLGKIRGNPLNLNDDVAWLGLKKSEDIILDNDNLFATRTRVISGEGLRFLDSGAIDTFLIANASRAAYPNLNTLSPWMKYISIYGTRTPASDAAISTLQSKGYTITLEI